MPHEYTVVCYEDKLDRLTQEVNRSINQGWQLLGGVSASSAYDAEHESDVSTVCSGS